jgi:TonB family protein
MFFDWRFWIILCSVCALEFSWFHSTHTKKDDTKTPPKETRISMTFNTMVSTPKKIEKEKTKTLQQKPKPVQRKKLTRKIVKQKAVVEKTVKKHLTQKAQTFPSPKIALKKTKPQRIIPNKFVSTTKKNTEATLRRKELMRDVWLTKLRQKLQNDLIYPYSALRKKQQGVVKLRLIVYCDGKLQKTKIIATSKHKTLDNASIELVPGIFPFLPFDAGVLGKTMEVDVPIYYILKEKK